jgi:ribonuclease P protein subunit RPR2
MVYRCNGCKTTRRIPAPPTLVPDMPRTLDLSSMEVVNVASLTHDAMSVDPTPEGSKSVEGSQASQNDKTQRKTLSKGTKPRLPPLFAREAGHVVFCGNERLSNVDPGRGNGIYIS